MNVPYAKHFLLALWAVPTGMFMGFLYEWFRILHRLHPDRKVLIFFEDLLFCLLCSVSMMLLFFNLSYGRMRFYGFVFSAAGFCLWYFTIGKAFRRGLRLLERAVSPVVSALKRRLAFFFSTRRFLAEAGKGFGARIGPERKKSGERTTNHVKEA